ncbi:large ribosomal subunit protein uL2z-like [Miscanthus floridulus]|uniref:large ribosomal subunit protein uL2z-like n=1 Tax=Miscanthus floridulus TaxID=154761 RepID=UPI00345872BA
MLSIGNARSVYTGQLIYCGCRTTLSIGDIPPLHRILEGAVIYNASTGAFGDYAIVVSHNPDSDASTRASEDYTIITSHHPDNGVKCLEVAWFFGGGTQEEHRHSSEKRTATSGANVAASSVGHAPSAVAHVPSVGQVDTGAKGAPPGAAEQTVAEVIPLPLSERTELPLMLVVLSVVGTTLQVKVPTSQAEVAATVTS